MMSGLFARYNNWPMLLLFLQISTSPRSPYRLHYSSMFVWLLLISFVIGFFKGCLIRRYPKRLSLWTKLASIYDSDCPQDSMDEIRCIRHRPLSLHGELQHPMLVPVCSSPPVRFSSCRQCSNPWAWTEVLPLGVGTRQRFPACRRASPSWLQLVIGKSLRRTSALLSVAFDECRPDRKMIHVGR